MKLTNAVPLVLALMVAIALALSPTTAGARGDMDCANFPSQKAAQIFFIKHGGPRYDPDRLDADHDGRACEDNPAPYYFGTHLP